MPSFSLKPKEFALSQESAEANIGLLLEFYDYDIDAQTEPLKTQMLERLNLMVRAIRLGQLEVKDGGLVVQMPTTKGVDKIEYKEFTGAAKRQLDRVPTGENYKKIHTLMGYLSGLPDGAFANLNAIDSAIVEALGLFFLSK